MNALQKWPGCHSQEETTAQLDLRDLRTQSQSSPAQGPQYSPWNVSPLTSRWMGHYPKLSTTAAPGKEMSQRGLLLVPGGKKQTHRSLLDRVMSTLETEEGKF